MPRLADAHPCGVYARHGILRAKSFRSDGMIRVEAFGPYAVTFIPLLRFGVDMYDRGKRPINRDPALLSTLYREWYTIGRDILQPDIRGGRRQLWHHLLRAGKELIDRGTARRIKRIFVDKRLDSNVLPTCDEYMEWANKIVRRIVKS